MTTLAPIRRRFLLKGALDRLPSVLGEEAQEAGLAVRSRWRGEALEAVVTLSRGVSLTIRVRTRTSGRSSVEGSAPAGEPSAREAALLARALETARAIAARWETADSRPDRAEAPLAAEVFGRYESEGGGVVSGGEASHESILRVSFACNQACGFCFVDLSKAMVPLEEIERRLDRVSARARAEEDLVISGGEPTAHPRFAEIVAAARAKGFRRVTIQTNAVYLAKKSLAEKIGPAAYFVSFHSHVPAIYDRLTSSKRQFALAAKGIGHLLSIPGNRVVLNVIINRLNHASLPAYVEYVDALRAGRAISIFFSVLNDVGLQRTPELGVDLRDVAVPLNRALDLCRRRGVEVESITGNCAPPLCLVDDPAAYAGRSEYTQDDVLYQDSFAGGDDRGRAKRAACRTCAYDRRCRGVPMRYARTYGVGALKPIRP